jgi:hypothetical protein
MADFLGKAGFVRQGRVEARTHVTAGQTAAESVIGDAEVMDRPYRPRRIVDCDAPRRYCLGWAKSVLAVRVPLIVTGRHGGVFDLLAASHAG